MDDTHTFRHGDSSPGFSQFKGDRSNSPESSCVSMKSDASMDQPMKFEGKHTSTDLRCCLLTFLLNLPCVACLTVHGQKGGSVTLPCDLITQKDLYIVLTFGSKYAYGVRQSAEFKGRVHKSGTCDLILQGLKTTDAGKYISEIFDNGHISKSYEVHITYKLTGQKGEELVFDLLPREAEKVRHQTDTDWEEVWKRGQDDNQLTYKNGALTIRNFSSSNAGTYLVLNSSGATLNTVTVTESESTEISTKGEHNTSGSRKTGVCWIAELLCLICLFIGYLQGRTYHWA